MKLIVPTASLLLLAACSTAQWNDMRANPREYFNLDRPVIEADARIEGQRVVLNRGQALVVRLDEDPAYAQRWEMRPIASSMVVAPVQHDFVTKPGTDPAAQDAPGQAVFRLRGVAPGTQPVVLELKRPLEASASRTIPFEVVVR